MVVTLRLWDPRRMAPVIGRPARWWRVHQDLSSCSKPRFQVGYSRGSMWQRWKNEGKTKKWNSSSHSPHELWMKKV